jgi:TP901 family phage tail tape measure protein
MALGVGVPIPTIATAGIRLVPDLTGFSSAVRAGGINQATVGAGAATAAITGAAAAAVAFGAASVAAAKKASDSFVAYEDSLIKIQTLTGTSAEVTDEWGQRILELAPEVGRGPQELADALFFVASAGVEGEAAFETLEASARGAALGLGSTVQVADAVTSAIGAYGIESLSAAEATDILAATVDRGKVEADALAGSIGRVIPIAAAAGVEFAEVGAAVAALSRTGLDADEATTALRQLLNNLVNPSRESADALASVGLEAQEVRDLLRQDLLGTLELLRDRFDGNTEGLFNLIPNIRAVTGFLSLMGENAAGTRDIFEDLAGATGFVDERFGILAESQAQRRAQALAAIEAVFIGSGSGSAEAITSLLEKAAEILPDIIPDLVAIGEQLLIWAGAAADIAAGFVSGGQDETTLLGAQFARTRAGDSNAFEFISTALYGLVFDEARAAVDESPIGTYVDDFYTYLFGTETGEFLSLPEIRRRRASEAGTDALAAANAADREAGLFGGGQPPTIDVSQYVDPLGRIALAWQDVNEQTGQFSFDIANLRGPDGQVVDQFGVLRDAIGDVIAEADGLGEALLALTDPGYRAISAVEDLEAAWLAVVDPGSAGGREITDAEYASLARPFLEANAALEALSPEEAVNYRTIVGEAITALGGDAEAVFAEGGVWPLAWEYGGEVTADVLGEDGPILSNLNGWGTATLGPKIFDEANAGISDTFTGWGSDSFGPAMAGELESAISVVQNRLGIKSPSSVFAAEVGKPIAQGIAQGFREGIPDILAAFAELPSLPGGPAGPYGGSTVNVYYPKEESIAGGVSRADALVRNQILK